MQTGEKGLARAVIYQALKDANRHKDSFVRQSARNFLCASNPIWARSLRLWCDIGDFSYSDVVFFSRKRFLNGRTVKTSND